MTIEIAMRRGDTQIQLGELAPGEITRFSDFSAGIHRLVIARCRNDDQGGEVYHLEDPTTDDADANAVVGRQPAATIEPGSTYEQDILMGSRRASRLILTHRLSHQA